MDSSNKIKNYFKGLKQAIDNIDQVEVENLANAMIKAYNEEKQIFIFGNGGSAVTASHIACDVNKGCSYGLEKRFKMICLNDNLATIMAYSNDVGYDIIFKEQLKNFLNPGDLVIGISGSGNSENVLKAIEYANEKNAVTFGLCGYDGGKLKQKAKYSIHANVDDMQKSEDIHLIVGHILMQIIAEKLGVEYC